MNQGRIDLRYACAGTNSNILLIYLNILEWKNNVEECCYYLFCNTDVRSALSFDYEQRQRNEDPKSKKDNIKKNPSKFCFRKWSRHLRIYTPLNFKSLLKAWWRWVILFGWNSSCSHFHCKCFLNVCIYHPIPNSHLQENKARDSVRQQLNLTEGSKSPKSVMWNKIWVINTVYLCFAIWQFHSSHCETSDPSRETQWERQDGTFSSSRVFHRADEAGEQAKEKVTGVVNSQKEVR